MRTGPKPNLFDENGILNVPCKMCGCKIIKGKNAVYRRISVFALCIDCFRKKNNERQRIKGYNRSFLYDLSVDEYNKILDAQNGVCAICKMKNKIDRPLGVDHNHRTNKIRGLLCNDCNSIIGHAFESTQILANALAYLIKHTDFGDKDNAA